MVEILAFARPAQLMFGLRHRRNRSEAFDVGVEQYDFGLRVESNRLLATGLLGFFDSASRPFNPDLSPFVGLSFG